MKLLNYIFLIITFTVTLNLELKSQGVNCNNPDPFCTGTTATFPAGVNNGDAMTTDPGNNYGCLGSAPNPAWYYMEIDQPGSLTITMTNSNNVDIDFILWGPYPNLTAAINDCGTIASGSSPANIIDCSYSTAATETGTIPNAQNGEVYILLVTNFSNTPTNISFTNTSGTATTNCSIVNPCTMTGITTNVSTCDPNTNTYTTTGTVTFTAPPTTGNLIVQDCNGNQDIIPAPFTSPANYTIANQTADGLPCSITAYFSADNTCTITSSTYNAPQCASCFMDSLLITINPCDPNTNDYSVDAYVSFLNAPTTGYLIIVDSLSGVADTIYPPFISDQTYTLNGINSTGNNSAITAYFSADPSCSLNITYTAPASCACPADAGTSTAYIFGSGNNNYILCDGDTFIAVSNNDTTNAIGVPPGAGPGITYGIYVCPPTPGIDPATDPCYTGYVTGTISYMADINQNGGLYGVLNGLGFPITNQTIYFAPMTLIDTTNLLYNPNCVDIGQVLAVTYLNPIQTNIVEDCVNGEVTITVSGGYPEIFPSGNYNIQNLQPTTATLNTTTVANSGGSFIIQNLQPGDNYSVDIIDDNGCPYTITGGPFPGAVITDTIYSNVTCNGANNGSIQIVATNATQYSIDNGTTWQASNTFTGLGPGTYQCVADDGTGCQDMVTVTLTEPTALSIPRTITNATCFGSCDGSIVVAPQGGVQPYSYSWTNGNTTPTNTNLCAGSYTLTLTDNNGCTLDSTFIITEPTDFTFTTSSVNANCGFADGSASINNFSGGTPGYTYSWSNGGTGSSQNNLTPGNYSVTVTDAAGCDTTITITVGNNPGFTASISTFTDASCNGLCDGTATAQGSDPLATYSFLWDNNANSQTTATANNLCAGNYYCIVTDVNSGCQDTAFVTISEPTPVTVSVSNDTVICVGTSATISANAAGGTPNYTYNWDNGYSGQTQTVNPTGNTTYTVIATDANGCTSQPNSVTVSLYPVLNLTVSPDVSICPGDNTTLSANVSGGNGGPYAYLWNNGSTSSTQDVSPTSTTTYYVTATDNCSPSVVDSVLVTVFPLPQVSFTADTFSGCEPLTVTFYNTTNNSANPMWQFGDGSSGVGDTIVHVYQNDGTYDVQLTVSNTPALGGCIDSLTQQNYITVYNTPVADFSFEPDTIDMLNPTVEFIDQSYSNIVYWEWNINNFDTLYTQNPTYVFPEDTGTYFISLYVENQYGCKDSITKLIRENGVYTIYIPNAFTPIDSKGINDYFRPYGIGISDEDYNFYIFDRWGELIYEGHSFTSDKGWDGTYKGTMVQLGVYVWKLEFKDINNKHHVLHGRVTIVK